MFLGTFDIIPIVPMGEKMPRLWKSSTLLTKFKINIPSSRGNVLTLLSTLHFKMYHIIC